MGVLLSTGSEGMQDSCWDGVACFAFEPLPNRVIGRKKLRSVVHEHQHMPKRQNSSMLSSLASKYLHLSTSDNVSCWFNVNVGICAKVADAAPQPTRCKQNTQHRCRETRLRTAVSAGSRQRTGCGVYV